MLGSGDGSIPLFSIAVTVIPPTSPLCLFPFIYLFTVWQSASCRNTPQAVEVTPPDSTSDHKVALLDIAQCWGDEIREAVFSVLSISFKFIESAFECPSPEAERGGGGCRATTKAGHTKRQHTNMHVQVRTWENTQRSMPQSTTSSKYCLFKL